MKSFYWELASIKLSWIRNRRWCEKTPKNIIFFGKILKFFDDNVKLINIVRDGRDVILSKHPKNTKEFWVSPERWINDVSEGMKYENNPNVLTIRYEDLIIDYEKTIKKILDFIGEKMDKQIRNWHKYAKLRKNVAIRGHIKDTHTKSVGKWKNPIYKKRICKFMKKKKAVDLLKHYRYID